MADVLRRVVVLTERTAALLDGVFQFVLSQFLRKRGTEIDVEVLRDEEDPVKDVGQFIRDALFTAADVPFKFGSRPPLSELEKLRSFQLK